MADLSVQLKPLLINNLMVFVAKIILKTKKKENQNQISNQSWLGMPRAKLTPFYPQNQNNMNLTSVFDHNIIY